MRALVLQRMSVVLATVVGAALAATPAPAAAHNGAPNKRVDHGTSSNWSGYALTGARYTAASAHGDHCHAPGKAVPEVDYLLGFGARFGHVLPVVAPKVEESLVAVVALAHAESPSGLDVVPDLHVRLEEEQRALEVFPARRRPEERADSLDPAPP